MGPSLVVHADGGEVARADEQLIGSHSDHCGLDVGVSEPFFDRYQGCSCRRRLGAEGVAQ